MKGFAYLKDNNLVHVNLKYPDDMPDKPTLDDLANYCAKHRLEEYIIREHNIHTQLFLQLVQDKRLVIQEQHLKEWKELNDTP